MSSRLSPVIGLSLQFASKDFGTLGGHIGWINDGFPNTCFWKFVGFQKLRKAHAADLFDHSSAWKRIVIVVGIVSSRKKVEVCYRTKVSPNIRVGFHAFPIHIREPARVMKQVVNRYACGPRRKIGEKFRHGISQRELSLIHKYPYTD